MIESLVREQYGRSVDILERGRLTDGVIIPTEAECIDILRDSLTDVQIKHVQDKMRRRLFQIVPQKPFADFKSALHLNRREDELMLFIDPDIEERLSKMPSSNEVQIGFIEGLGRLPGTPLMRCVLPKQRKFYKKLLPKGVKVIHPRNYVLLQIDGRVDIDRWTPLEDKSKDTKRFLGGSCYCTQIGFSVRDPEDDAIYARWRSSVMVAAN